MVLPIVAIVQRGSTPFRTAPALFNFLRRRRRLVASSRCTALTFVVLFCGHRGVLILVIIFILISVFLTIVVRTICARIATIAAISAISAIVATALLLLAVRLLYSRSGAGSGL